ncbi:MAG: sulfite exporter TauE/SafE family protein [Candidatus Hydrogenedentes bacterium]|nr:sulfite exporter TauE/SafE family protein [Candidatus Hydrogenedentota bacterium]
MFDDFILPGVPWAVFWVFASVGILIQGISKSGFAGGAGILSLPLMMLVMPVQKVTAMLLPLLILCDLNAIYHHRHNKDWKVIRAIYIPSIVGIVLGAAVWWYVGREDIQQYAPYIKKFVGVMAILFALYIFVREAAMELVSHYRPGPRVTWAAGIAAGFCSTIAHAAGPIAGLYIFAHHLGKSLFVGTVAWTFTLINLTKLPFYIAVGLLKTDVLLLGLVLVPLIPIGSYMGKWMHHRVPESPFNWIICVLTILAAVQLLFNIDLVQIGLRAIYPGA